MTQKKGLWLMWYISLGLLTACGGGSNGRDGGPQNGGDNGGNNGDSGGSTALIGVLLDAEVEGVDYLSNPSGRSGVTNAAGEFLYVAGDTITFSVGNIALGAVPAKGVLTPLDIARAQQGSLPDGVTVGDVATNIAIFLQTLDTDGNPDNGITIDARVIATLNDLASNLNFLQLIDDFSIDQALLAVADELKIAIVTPEEALAHNHRSLVRFMEGSWLIDPSTEPGSDFAILTLLATGEYVLGIKHLDQDCFNGVEFGTYDLDATTMTLIVTGNKGVDTTGPNGECGLYEDGDGAILELTLESSTRFSFHSNDMDAPIVLGKIPSDGITGSWSEWDFESFDLISVPTFLADGRYMIAQVKSTEDDSPVGLETGTYRLAANRTTFTSVVDTNGHAGFTHGAGEAGEGPVFSVDSFGRLQFEVEGEGLYTMASIPYRLTLEGNTANSVGSLVLSTCPGVLGGWLYTFGSTEITLRGADEWNDCVLSEEQEFSKSYNEPHMPFACGSPVCGFGGLNKTLTGIEFDGRPFRSSYTHIPGSHVVHYEKEIIEDEGDITRFTETITLGNGG